MLDILFMNSPKKNIESYFKESLNHFLKSFELIQVGVFSRLPLWGLEKTDLGVSSVLVTTTMIITNQDEDYLIKVGPSD